MLNIYRKFQKFIGKDAAKFRGTILLSLVESLVSMTKIVAIWLVLRGVLMKTADYGSAWKAFGIMVTGIILAIFLKARTSMQQTEIGYGVAAKKRMEIGSHLRYLPMGYFSKRSLGEITAIATNTCNQVQETATMAMLQITTGLANATVMTLLLLGFDWRVGLVSVAAILVFFLHTSYVLRKFAALSKEKIEAESRLIAKVLEYIQGMQVVKNFNLKGKNRTGIYEEIERNKRVNLAAEVILLPAAFIFQLLTKAASLATVIMGILFWADGSMAIYDGVMLVIVGFILFNHLETAGMFVIMLRLLGYSMDRINEIQEVPVMDEKGTTQTPVSNDLELENVSFAYDEREILHDINLKVPERTTLAVVGPSGSGKTTLVKLMARFWDVGTGKITLGGIDVRDYTLDSLWENFSVVFQDVYLFADTVENNIRFGVPDASREEVVEAAKRARCHEFIERLEAGYDTVIGEGGATLSGGEAQRISIARAMLKDTPIIILDEATANVDPENEDLLQGAIEELTRKKTVIMIAHRLKTVRNADQIVVLNEGRVEAVGTHEELMQRAGTYREFIRMRTQCIGWKPTV